MSEQYEFTNNLVGKETGALDTSPTLPGYSAVEIVIDEDNTYFYGNTTGRTLRVDNPFGSRVTTVNDPIVAQTAAAILASVQGFQYQPYKAEGAILNPAAEIGDAITVEDMYSGIYKQARTFGSLMRATVSAPQDEEIDHEYPYTPKRDREFRRQIEQNSTEITQNSEQIALTAASVTSLDESLKSDNLIPFPYYENQTVQRNGITFTQNSDGSVKINGTASKNAYFYFTQKGTPELKLQTGTYTLSDGDGYVSPSITVSIQRYDGSATHDVESFEGPTKKKTVDWTWPNQSVTMWIRVASGATISNKTVKVQLEYGGTARAWQPPIYGTTTTRDALVKHEAELSVQADEISAKVSQQSGTVGSSFAWKLQSGGHYWYKNGSTTPVMSVTADGLTVNGSGTFSGTISATDGYFGSSASNGFTISSNGIGNNMTGVNDTSHTSGIFLGKDGIALGGGKFKVTKEGAVTAGNVSFTGGTIGGFTIGSSSISKTMTGRDDTTNDGVWIGTDGIALGKGNFKVTNAGALTAKSGTIGGFKIGSNSLASGITSWSDTSNEGVYIGYNGISLGAGKFRAYRDGSLKLGDNFSVNKSGDVTAKSITLKGTLTFQNADGSGSGTMSATSLRSGAGIGSSLASKSGYTGTIRCNHLIAMEDISVNDIALDTVNGTVCSWKTRSYVDSVTPTYSSSGYITKISVSKVSFKYLGNY